MKQLIHILETYLSEQNWSIASAGELEGTLDEYSEIDGVQDLQDTLASYRPGGGDYLYDKDQLERNIISLIKVLRR